MGAAISREAAQPAMIPTTTIVPIHPVPITTQLIQEVKVIAVVEVLQEEQQLQ